jgi:rubrerythrin
VRALFGKNPLELRRPLEKEGICDALRLALIAELDAITLYEQLARSIEDPLVKKVFLEVANEEREHVGEFLYLLRRCDSNLDKMLEKGEEEVKELEELEDG